MNRSDQVEADEQIASKQEGRCNLTKPGIQSEVSAKHAPEAARGTNRNWVSCFCSLGGPVFLLVYGL